MKDDQALKILILEEAAFYDAPMNDLKLKTWVQALSELDLSELRKAMAFYRTEKGRRQMPMPADFKARIQPAVDPRMQAVDAASRVQGAVVKFGWQQRDAARHFIGELGWIAVGRFGGWQRVCELLGTRDLPLSTFQAQVRDLLEAQLQFVTAGISGPPQLPESGSKNKTAELESADVIIKRVTGDMSPKE